MAYNQVTFVPGEILTAAKMNLLAGNDASLRDGTGISDGAIEPKKLDGSKFVLLDYNTTGNAKLPTRTFNAPEDCKVKITVSLMD